jgi:hypothetical protein
MIHVNWVSCLYGMVRTQVADRAEGLQIWRVSVNILNKQSQADDSGWSSSLNVGRGLTTPTVKKQFFTKYFTQPRN